jgi:hypothetical protein
MYTVHPLFSPTLMRGKLETRAWLIPGFLPTSWAPPLTTKCLQCCLSRDIMQVGFV